MGDDHSGITSLAEIDELIHKLQEISASDAVLAPEIQEEIGNLLDITARLKSHLSIARLHNQKLKEAQLEAIIPNVKIAIYAAHKNSNKVLIKKLRRDVEYSIHKIEHPLFTPLINLFKHFLYKTETHTKVCFGLFAALPIHLLSPVVLAYLLVTANIYLQPLFAENAQLQQTSQGPSGSPPIAPSQTARISQYDFQETSVLLILCAMAGSTGSVVSIMLRLDQYRNPKYKETLLPVFVGAFKPAIGAFLGIFVFTLIGSTLLPITLSKDESKPMNRWLAFLAISFVVGFSERLANDLVSQAEQIVPGGKGSEKSSNSSESDLLTTEDESTR